MRHEGTFGEDAEMSRPERWLDIPVNKWRVMEQTVLMDFASGSRWECLGKTIAMIELNKTYVEVSYR